MESTDASAQALTKLCLTKFSGLCASGGKGDHGQLEPRLADVRLWADNVGALAKPGFSLDSRLRGRPEDLNVVKRILIMLADSLDYYGTLSEDDANLVTGMNNIDSSIRNLILIGVAIRRTGKASRSRRAGQTFNPDNYDEFRRHLECIVLLHPTRDAHEAGDLDASKLSQLQKRLIHANLRRRHSFLVAQKHSMNHYGAVTKQPAPQRTTSFDTAPEIEPRPVRVPTQKPGKENNGPRSHPKDITKNAQRAPTVVSGFSHASTAAGTMKYNPSKAMTQITNIASDAEFPRPPDIILGRAISRCPCCCQAVPVNTLRDLVTWKKHIIEDLCPYTCIAQDCPTPHEIFCTRNEWMAHVKRVHPKYWECPFCEEEGARCTTQESMTAHFLDHHEDEVLENQPSTLLSWSEVQNMGITSCPLCPSHGPEDSPTLITHVLQHTYEFALRALPWPQPPAHNVNAPPGSFRLPNDAASSSSLLQWLDGVDLHDETAVGLQLSSYETDIPADDAPPDTQQKEYTDYFLTNRYFGEMGGDGSSRIQSHQSSSRSSLLEMDANVCISPNGRLIASGLNRDNSFVVSVTTSGQHHQSYYGHTEEVLAIAFSPDGKLLVSSSNDCSVRIWNLATAEWTHVLEAGITFQYITFSADSHKVAMASETGVVKICDLASHEYWTLRLPYPSITCATFSRDLQYLAYAVPTESGQSIYIKSLDPNIEASPYIFSHGDIIGKGSLNTVAFSHDGHMIAYALRSSTAYLVDVRDGVLCAVPENVKSEHATHTQGFFSVFFSSGDEVLACISAGSIRLLYTQNTTIASDIDSGVDLFASASFVGKDFLVSISRYNEVNFWTRGGECFGDISLQEQDQLPEKAEVVSKRPDAEDNTEYLRPSAPTGLQVGQVVLLDPTDCIINQPESDAIENGYIFDKNRIFVVAGHMSKCAVCVPVFLFKKPHTDSQHYGEGRLCVTESSFTTIYGEGPIGHPPVKVHLTDESLRRHENMMIDYRRPAFVEYKCNGASAIGSIGKESIKTVMKACVIEDVLLPEGFEELWNAWKASVIVYLHNNI